MIQLQPIHEGAVIGMQVGIVVLQGSVLCFSCRQWIHVTVRNKMDAV